MASKFAESWACISKQLDPLIGGGIGGVMNRNAEPALGLPSSWERAGGKAKGDKEEERE